MSRPTVRRLARRMHQDFRGALTTRQRSALIAYLSFAVTAPAVRGLAAAVRSGRFAARDVVVGDVHLHHYVPGIALLTLAGGLALGDSDRVGVHSWPAPATAPARLSSPTSCLC